MKVLVIGASGFLGKKICSVFSQKGETVIGTSNSEKSKNLIPLDIASRKKVFEVIEKNKLDIVINAAALTDVDWCESHEKECFNVNTKGAENIALACKKFGCKMIQVSTDFVFDGTKNSPYNETDTPNPVNVYSKSKLEAEKVIQKNLDDYLIVRTIVLYGFNDWGDKQNFVGWVLDKLKQGKEFRVVNDQKSCPALIDDVAQAIFVLAKKNKWGIFQASGAEYLSRLDFAKKIAKAFGFDERLAKPQLSDELNQKALRAKNLDIDLGRIKKEAIVMSNIERGLKKMKKQMEKAKKHYAFDLTVSIVNWNTKGLLKQCLDSVYKFTNGISFEVIVVDNASSDGSIEMVEKEFSKVMLIKNKENLGFGKAFNQAIRASKAKYVAVVSSDIIFLNNAMKKIVEFMEKNKKAAAVSCKLFNKDMTVQKNLAFFPTLKSEAIARIPLIPKQNQYELFDYDKTQEVETFVGACYVARKETTDAVGLYDEDFFIYVEETDWFYRMKKNGWKLFFLPDAKVIHLGGASAKNQAQRLLRYYLNLQKFFKKHYGWHKIFLLKAVCFASNVVTLVYAPFFALKNPESAREIFLTAAGMAKITLFEW